jgi:hypothetical protein
MQTFYFFLDEKKNSWMRVYFTVEANNIEEAKDIAIEKHKNGELERLEWEEISDFKEKQPIQ